VTPNKGYGPPIWGNRLYIYEVNRTEKVKSDAQVAMNKNSDPVQKLSLGVAGEDGAPNCNFSKLLELSEMSRGRKLIFRLGVDIDKAISRRYDVTW